MVGSIFVSAHRSGCHAAHTCPSDTGSYVWYPKGQSETPIIQRNLQERKNEIIIPPTVIRITTNGYEPQEVVVYRSPEEIIGKVIWENVDTKPHYIQLFSCTPDRQILNQLVKPGDSYKYVYNADDTFFYSCKKEKSSFQKGSLMFVKGYPPDSKENIIEKNSENIVEETSKKDINMQQVTQQSQVSKSRGFWSFIFSFFK